MGRAGHLVGAVLPSRSPRAFYLSTATAAAAAATDPRLAAGHVTPWFRGATSRALLRTANP